MTSDCVEWEGARFPNGYGTGPRSAGGSRLAHRQAWEAAHGPIPKGMVICHRCDNPPCVNLAHLFLGTQSDNIRDAHAKGRAHRGNQFQASKVACPKGHPYSPSNTYFAPSNGRRMCRECTRAAGRAYRLRKKMA